MKELIFISSVQKEFADERRRIRLHRKGDIKGTNGSSDVDKTTTRKREKK